MKRVLTAAVLALMASAAYSEQLPNPSTPLLRSGAWETFVVNSDQGSTMCGMKNDSLPNGLAFHVKYVNGDTGFRVHMFKSTWRFPSAPDKVSVPYVLGVDKNATLQGNASGWVQSEYKYSTPMLQITVADTKMALDMLDDMAGANWFWVKFTTGTEPPVMISMAGIRGIIQSFKSCIVTIIKATPTTPTQPYDSSNRQPTQPYGEKQVTPQPVQPKPTQPYGRGSI